MTFINYDACLSQNVKGILRNKYNILPPLIKDCHLLHTFLQNKVVMLILVVAPHHLLEEYSTKATDC